MPGRAALITTGWMTFIYWGWLKIARNDMFVPVDERQPVPHELLISFLSRRWNSSESATPSGDNDNKERKEACFCGRSFLLLLRPVFVWQAKSVRLQRTLHLDAGLAHLRCARAACQQVSLELYQSAGQFRQL